MSEQTKAAAITPDRVKTVEAALLQIFVQPLHGTVPEDLLRPEYWAHSAAKFKNPNGKAAIVWAESEDKSWFAIYRVMGADDGQVELRMLPGFTDLVTDASDDLPGFKTEWNRSKMRFDVLRLSDKKVMKDGLSTRAKSYAWQRDHLTAVAAAA